MASPVFVTALASDPITRAGLRAALSGFARIVVRIDDSSEPSAPPEDVTVVAADPVGDETVSLVRSTSEQGGRPVVVTEGFDDEVLAKLVEAGVRGIVRRSDCSPERLASVILAAANDEAAVPHDLLGRLLRSVPDAIREEVDGSARRQCLSERESTVLRLAADGLDTPEIAARLYYSERTVKSIIHDFVSRYQLRNRTHAVAYAVRQGWI